MNTQVSLTIQSFGCPDGSCQLINVQSLVSSLNHSGTSQLISLPSGLVAFIQWGTPFDETIFAASYYKNYQIQNV